MPIGRASLVGKGRISTPASPGQTKRAAAQPGGVTMVLTPQSPPQQGMPENAIRFDGPIDLVGYPLRIAQGICAACGAQKS